MTRKSGTGVRIAFGFSVCACTFLLLQFVSLYFNWQRQAIVGAVLVLVCLFLNRLGKGKLFTLTLMLLSLAATLRYGWWRVQMAITYFTDESNHRLSIDSALMLILLGAEMYTMCIMVMGYMQTSQTLDRKLVPMPADEHLWPEVDVLIPTYNEPLSLVRYTALAAINIDYPPDKLHVSILDDGSREEFRAFAEEAGISYIVREEHMHAKAGNINHALDRTSAPLVAIFDCDHVPTRSFLQCTVGWFLVEDKLAMVQTPHFFYSPDPFERNLLQYKDVPNEGELFYGIIQDGSDFWNATFFCGSCAVLRRKALSEIGGIATETVTEDAHTSLRMQKAGWSTAYINIAQAAGLATETLAAHVGQRVRWARGMIQILRLDNPLLGRGMKLSQRLCYFNAMLHFLYALPRLIFLTSPLAYMLAGRTIIPGYWLAILAYALPHLLLSSLTNSRIQSRHRHSFWNEIYETVLAPYILFPTLLALINPRFGKFNVTDKATILEETRYDRQIAAPTTWLLLLNLAGVLAAPYRLLVLDPQHPGVILSNLVWIFFNMVILGVAAAVAHEQKQRRTSVRISVQLAIEIACANNIVFRGETCDMSVGGASVRVDKASEMAMGDLVQVSFPQQTGEARITARVTGGEGQDVRLRFVNLTLQEEETLTRALYSRADSWLTVRRKVEVDRPLRSLGRVIRLSFTGFQQVALGLVPRRRASSTSSSTAAASTAASLVLMMLFGYNAGGQTRSPNLSSYGLQSPRQIDRVRTQGESFKPSQQRSTRILLKDLGVAHTADLRGPHGLYSVHFTLPYTDVPRSGTLLLYYAFTRELQAGSGRIQISLNGTAIAELHAHGPAGDSGPLAFERIPLPADSLIRSNELSFEFDGNAHTGTPNVPVLARLGENSRIDVTGDAVPFHNDLSFLPLPIFDPDVPAMARLTFAFPHQPDAITLQAAGVVASWLGVLSSVSPVRLSVVVGGVPPGNAVVFANRAEVLPAPLQIPRGSSYQIAPNPGDDSGSLLVIGGDSSEDLLTAARALSLLGRGHVDVTEASKLRGTVAELGGLALPPPRKVDDAPRWLPADRLVSLADYSPQPAMQGDGSQPLPVYFRVAPDTYYGEAQNLTLKVHYRYNSRPLTTGSALRMILNSEMVNEATLLMGKGLVEGTREAHLPVVNMRPFANTLLFDFDFVPVRRPGTGTNHDANQMLGTILRQTTLDLRNTKHYVAMPNLELFSNAGFPFTQKADLQGTTVILPRQPSAAEIALFLQLMEHCGRQTGYPVLRVQVAGPDELGGSDRDFLVLGTMSNQPAFNALEGVLPVSFDEDGVRVIMDGTQQAETLRAWRSFSKRVQGLFGTFQWRDEELLPDKTLPALAVLQGVQSPYGSGRSLIAVALRDDAAEESFASAFLDASQSSEISASFSLLQNGHFHSFAANTPGYHIGVISRYAVMRIWLTENFAVLMLAVIACSFVLASGIRAFLSSHAAERLRFPCNQDGTPIYRKLESSSVPPNAY